MFQSLSGPSLAANCNTPKALVAPSLGRSLSGGAANATVNLVAQGTRFGERVNQVDLRVAKLLRYAGDRPHPKYPDPLFNGNSSAWWEGDTLIIDTVAFEERTWISGNGWYHSDKLRVIERLRRPSKNYFEYQFTVEDPDVLTKTWTSGWRRFSLAQDDDHLLENYCTNEQNSEQFRILADQEAERAKQPPAAR